MSLKLVLFKSLGAVSYSPSIVTMAVSVAVGLSENYLLKSLEVAPCDRSHTSSYSPSIVTMTVSSAILEIFSVK